MLFDGTYEIVKRFSTVQERHCTHNFPLVFQFAGFSFESLAERLHDCQAKVLVTADAVYRGDKLLHLKNICDKGK